jgi:mono/diheme cytochrome c family protein
MRILLFVLLIACGDKEETLTGDAVNGESLFATNCSACHGADATGGSGPDLLSGSSAASSFTDEQLTDIIVNGVDGMPAIASLDDQSVVDIISYLRTME